MMFELSIASLGQSDFPCESVSIKDADPLTYGRGPIKIKDAVYRMKDGKDVIVSPEEWKTF